MVLLLLRCKCRIIINHQSSHQLSIILIIIKTDYYIIPGLFQNVDEQHLQDGSFSHLLLDLT